MPDPLVSGPPVSGPPVVGTPVLGAAVPGAAVPGRPAAGPTTVGADVGASHSPAGSVPQPQGGGVLHPRLSPDGERFAFTDAGRIWLMEIFERRPRRLTDDESDAMELFPAWSPQGRTIAFAAWPRSDAPGQIHQVGVEGQGRPQPVTRRGGWFAFPTYSPQGLQLVALRGPRRQLAPLAAAAPWRRPAGAGRGPTGLELVAAPARGITLGDPMQPAGALHALARPHFSDDPARVWVWQGERGLVSMRLDGSDRRVHLHVTAPAGPGALGPPAGPGALDPPAGQGAGTGADSGSSAVGEQEEREPPVEEVLIGPRGDRVLIHAAGEVWWMPLPAVGGDPLWVSLAQPDRAPLPLHRLARDIEFAAWSVGGTAITGSRGRSLFIWFLDREEELEVEVPPVR